MALSRERIRDLYRVRAKRYDLTANLYYLIGFREKHYRQRAVAALDLREGDVVVELGCGTGINFPLLQRRVGPEGRIIGVDLTDRMLDQAKDRTARHDWRNVEFVQADAATFTFPQGTRGILSTFALTMMPEYDRIIRKAREALSSGGWLAVLDLKKSAQAPLWMTRAMVRITSPFGVSLDLAERHPWESIERHFEKTSFEEFFFGYVYLSAGTVQESKISATSRPNVTDIA